MADVERMGVGEKKEGPKFTQNNLDGTIASHIFAVSYLEKLCTLH
jgi:hypothetical protein